MKKGRDAELLVKQQLWRNGYSVKDVCNVAPYDLLVDGKIRVEVKSAKATRNNKWKFIHLKMKPYSMDVIAIVIYSDLGNGIYYAKVSDKLIEDFQEDKIFLGRGLTATGDHYIYDIVLTAETLKKYFTKSLTNIFGKDKYKQ